jgi:hypothetical protein
MLLGTAKKPNYYLLPSGTTLYYDGSLPEGVVRYRIYVNVEGVQHELQPVADPETISPATLYPVGKDDLISLLNAVKLDKDDVKAILSNGQFSDSDKKEIADMLQRSK